MILKINEISKFQLKTINKLLSLLSRQYFMSKCLRYLVRCHNLCNMQIMFKMLNEESFSINFHKYLIKFNK